MPLSSDGNPSSTLYLLSAYRQRACAQAWADGSSPCGRAAAVHSGLHSAPLCCAEFRRLHSKPFIKCTSQRSSVAWDDINNSGRGFQHFQSNGGLEQTGEHKAGSLSQTDLLVSTVFGFAFRAVDDSICLSLFTRNYRGCVSFFVLLFEKANMPEWDNKPHWLCQCPPVSAPSLGTQRSLCRRWRNVQCGWRRERKQWTSDCVYWWVLCCSHSTSVFQWLLYLIVLLQETAFQRCNNMQTTSCYTLWSNL